MDSSDILESTVFGIGLLTLGCRVTCADEVRMNMAINGCEEYIRSLNVLLYILHT